MSSDFKLTETEQQILDEARSLLGSNLSDYLLSGLGETEITHCRAFSARSTSRHSENVTYRFEMIGESEQALPRGRDPLVLAALLLEACKYRTVTSTVSSAFRFLASDIIKKLQWPQSDDSKLLVKRALERYLRTGFYLIDPTISEEERIFHRYSHCRRLLVGYGITFIGMPDKRGGQRQSQVMFLPEFIEGLMMEEKKILGLAFQRLFGMRRIAAGESES